MNKTLNLTLIFLLVLLNSEIFSWGRVAHSIINRNCVKFFPEQMQSYKIWSEYLASHASEPDDRKGQDKTEGPKHYFDADAYPDFFSHTLSSNLDTLISKNGNTFVFRNGILPWAISNSYDSLVSSLKRKDWNLVLLFASDLGHYIADIHQPNHLTKNYDGQLTNQKGLHSRYETWLINRYSGTISIEDGIVDNIDNKTDKIFKYLYKNFVYLDSVLIYDSLAKSQAGSYQDDQYLNIFWNYAGNFTKQIIEDASKNLASFIFSAWLEAGKPDFNSTMVENLISIPKVFTLFQNNPNPFNYSTSIKFYIPTELDNKIVTVELYDSLGTKVSTLFENKLTSGFHQFEVEAKYLKLNQGNYLYTVKVGDIQDSKKMTYSK